jgi:hypothetical protein
LVNISLSGSGPARCRAPWTWREDRTIEPVDGGIAGKPAIARLVGHRASGKLSAREINAVEITAREHIAGRSVGGGNGVFR